MTHPRSLDHLFREVLLLGHMLGALEGARVPMRASEYRRIAECTALALNGLDTATLRSLRDAIPPTLRCVVENLLHGRFDAKWVHDDAGTLAREVWDALHERLTDVAPPR
jgi:hypothetical protein